MESEGVTASWEDASSHDDAARAAAAEAAEAAEEAAAGGGPSAEERAAAAALAALEAAVGARGGEEAFRVEAWIAPTYALTVEVDPDKTVRALRAVVEDAFCRTFGFSSLPVFALQDPNHNDLPGACKLSLCLQSGDRVYVHLRREAYCRISGITSPVNGAHQVRVPPSPSTRLASQIHNRFGSRIAECFRSYFDLRERLLRPHSVVRIKAEASSSSAASAAAAAAAAASPPRGRRGVLAARPPQSPCSRRDADIVLERIQRVLQSPSNAQHREEVRSCKRALETEELVRRLDALTDEDRQLLPQIGQAVVQELRASTPKRRRTGGFFSFDRPPAPPQHPPPLPPVPEHLPSDVSAGSATSPELFPLARGGGGGGGGRARSDSGSGSSLGAEDGE